MRFARPRSWQPDRRSRKFRRMFFEPLEPRQMLAELGLPPAITVGRVASVWSVADVQNHQVKIDYTVYND